MECKIIVDNDVVVETVFVIRAVMRQFVIHIKVMFSPSERLSNGADYIMYLSKLE